MQQPPKVFLWTLKIHIEVSSLPNQPNELIESFEDEVCIGCGTTMSQDAGMVTMRDAGMASPCSGFLRNFTVRSADKGDSMEILHNFES